MDNINARPNLLKQANLSLIRNVIKANHTATRAEIVRETKISSTTVRSLLSEMLQSNEIESIGYDESSGGRKAERYRFKPGRYYCAAFCVTDSDVITLLVNVCGEIVETEKLEMKDGDFESVIISSLDQLTTEKEIKSIGIGISGVVDGNSYWKKNMEDEELYQINIGDVLTKRYKIPVVLENDLNAAAAGFQRCYEQNFPQENPEQTNMAYLHFGHGCISAGFIAGGRVIRGSHNYAGELGLLPSEDGKTLDSCMKDTMPDTQYIHLSVNIISWICGILNPGYVALTGPAVRESCLAYMNDVLHSLLPSPMAAELLYSPDMLHDYLNGMAYLTSLKMFEEVQFVKE